MNKISFFKGRWTAILCGLISISLGWGYYKYGWDFRTGFPIPRSTGILLIFIGIFFITFGLLRKIDLKEFNELYLKCLNCGKILRVEEAKDFICPHCFNKMEELEGFYDRHPELNQKKQ